MKELLLANPVVRKVWGRRRAYQMLTEYRKRRENYARLAEAAQLTYSAAGSVARVRARIAGRGYSVTKRTMGDVHTFAFIPRVGWHNDLFFDLEQLGPVTEFDYAALGYRPQELFDPIKRRAVNAQVLPALRAANEKRPVDWVFLYASGLEIEAGTIAQIRDEFGIPTVNMCLDDKQSWTGPRVGSQRLGQIDILAEFDISWTSSRVACEWYLVEGGLPLYLPEGFSATTHYPVDVAQDIPVSFIGAAYGIRPAVVRDIARHGIEVKTFGAGWANSWAHDVNIIINRSRINFGMGAIGYTNEITNLKGRDFEIPGTGGGVYLTSFNSDLAQHYVIGEEILCYRDRDEMIELLRYYLARPEEAQIISRAARERSLREHRWLHRYQTICAALGLLDSNKCVE